jgi:hypothetical protein
MEAALHTNIQSIDERLWSDVRQALDNISRHAEDILAEWVVVGQRLDVLRERYPGKTGEFGITCRLNGCTLTANERSAAMWWAQLDDRQRDVLSEKNPNALHPEWLQERCRDTHPEWAKTRKFSVSASRGNQKIPGKTKSALPASAKKQIEAEVLREELKAKRERREAAAAEAAANDRRPTLTETPYPVIMYGRQLWPITEAERVTLGQYDYDQLVMATKFFIAQRDLARMHPADLAANLRLRLRSLHQFVDRRLPQPLEMVRFLEVFHLLCRLLEADPDGACHPPSDRQLMEAP